MNDNAVVDAVEAIGASVSSLAALARRGTGGPVQTGADAGLNRADPLQDRADAYVEGLAEAAKLEARVAALKVLFADGFASTVADLAPPDASRQAHAAVQVSVTAEVACVLTVSEGAAARFLAESARLSTDLPLTLAALQAGTVSWQHARVMCDETDGLEPDAAAALEAHFLDPDAPSPARGCPAGELTPGRFRAKARYWRERHHPVGIEARHAKCAKDRRLEYVPDRDGMAWLSAYLPADQAAGIWDRTTTAARALQGPTESRTLTQLRADAGCRMAAHASPGQ